MASQDPETNEIELLASDEYRLSDKQEHRQSAWYTPHGWLCEILSTATSLCCTLALAILLSHVQNQPYDEWRFYIGLNPTISTLTTIARGTLLLSVSACLSQGKWLQFVRRSQLYAVDLFDRASRGPLGALAILFKIKTYTGLPALAAAITLLALGIGPFTQQVVTYDQRSIDIPSEGAYFNSAHHYVMAARSERITFVCLP